MVAADTVMSTVRLDTRVCMLCYSVYKFPLLLRLAQFITPFEGISILPVDMMKFHRSKRFIYPDFVSVLVTSPSTAIT